jgi:16S rRNA (cytidine(1402)-2'-O)-methyltransferase
VQSAIAAGIQVVPLPGPCALVAAVVASGLPTETFTFCGFLPPKQGARVNKLQQLRTLASTLIFYSPPHSIKAVLQDMQEVLGPNRFVGGQRSSSVMVLHIESFFHTPFFSHSFTGRCVWQEN